MIYQRNFIKELTVTAVAIFVVLLAILISTQTINLLGRAARGVIAIDAVAALVGFWTLGLTPLLLILTAFISILTVLTRYWRDSEMSVWLACGLSLKSWVRPVLRFCLPFMLLIAVMALWVLPWADLRSREFAQILKQRQDLSLIEQGVFREVGKDKRVYFVEQFDHSSGQAHNVFIREQMQDGRTGIIMAQSGRLSIESNQRTLHLNHGRRYSGTPGQADYDVVSFEQLDLIISTTPKIVNPIDNRQSIPTSVLFASEQPRHKAELMWRLSMPLSVLILGLLAVPLSYFNPRTGHTYNILLAVGAYLLYQNGLTFLRGAVESGKLPFLIGFLPMHVLMLALAWLLIRYRSQPAGPMWASLRASLKVGRS